MEKILQSKNPGIAPIGSDRQQEVIAHTETLIQDAGRFFDTHFPVPDIRFHLTGQRAGLYAWRRNGDCYIDYNPSVFAIDFQHHVSDTVAHEVAHHVAHQLHGHHIKPHGREWKLIAKLLGATPRASGDYSLEGASVRRQRRYDYQCRCRNWPVTATRHNRILKGAEYRCRQCGSVLKTAGDSKSAEAGTY